MTCRPLLYALCLGFVLSGQACERRAADYALSPEEALADMLKADAELTLPEARQLLTQPADQRTFVDLRSIADFNKGHLEGAINIPVSNLLDGESLALLRNAGGTIVLYGADASAANGPWLLLRQLGFDQIKVLQGGYDAFLLPVGPGQGSLWAAEVPRYDYRDVFNKAVAQYEQEMEATRPEAAPVPPPARVIVPQAKKPKKAEEEEGC